VCKFAPTNSNDRARRKQAPARSEQQSRKQSAIYIVLANRSFCALSFSIVGIGMFSTIFHLCVRALDAEMLLAVVQKVRERAGIDRDRKKATLGEK
jgi:hypothetical protein